MVMREAEEGRVEGGEEGWERQGERMDYFSIVESNQLSNFFRIKKRSCMHVAQKIN